MEPTEIIAAINAHIDGDKQKAKDFAKAMRANAPVAAQALMNAGASVKERDLDGKFKTLETDRDEWKEKAEALEQEFAEFKTKTPDAAAIEARERQKWEPKVTKERERAEQAATALRDERKKLAVSQFVTLLTTPDERGARVEPKWAQRVVAQEYADRFVVKEDGTLGVLQIGETTEYDGETLEQKVAALAKDARKTVDSGFVLTGADSGSGVRNGGGGTVVKTEAQLAAEMRASRGNQRAF